MGIKVFTKKDYTRYMILYRNKIAPPVNILRDVSEKYGLEILEEIPEEVHQRHDKVMKKIFERLKEGEFIIKKALNLRKNRKISLEIVGNEFITRDFRGKKLDVLYKLKNKEVYFMIEHQSTQDPHMAYRILEYEVEVMERSFRNNLKLGKYARVIAIVVYTGPGEWKPEQSILEAEERFGRKLKARKDHMGLGEFNLISASDYTREELLEEGMLISKVMLIEQAKGEEDLINILDEIIPRVKEDEKGIMIEILEYILVRELGAKKAQEYINKLEGDGDMLAVIDTLKKDREKTIRDARAEGRAEGKAEGRTDTVFQAVRKMLNKNMKDEDIMEYMDITKEELEELKLQMA